MKKYQTSLLAGVAALALVAGAGVASAQQSHMGGSMGGSTGGSQAGSPQASQSMSKGSETKGSETKRSETKGTQTQAQEKTKGTQTQAQEKGRSSENQAQQQGKTETNRTAQSGKENMSGQDQRMGRRGERAERNNHGSKSSRQAERQNTLKGLRSDTTKPMQGENEKSSTSTKSGTSNEAQRGSETNQRGTENNQRGTETNQGSARMNGGSNEARSSTEVRGGGSVNLTEQQRTEIKTTVIQGHNAPRVGHVDFDVRVGTAVPRGKIHVVPVPETLVRIEPRWRGFMYFVYEDEVVIVDPHDYKIVAVVPV
jgi:hypothetical protein